MQNAHTITIQFSSRLPMFKPNNNQSTKKKQGKAGQRTHQRSS
jgi:hypothetical protein